MQRKFFQPSDNKGSSTEAQDTKMIFLVYTTLSFPTKITREKTFSCGPWNEAWGTERYLKILFSPNLNLIKKIDSEGISENKKLLFQEISEAFVLGQYTLCVVTLSNVEKKKKRFYERLDIVYVEIKRAIFSFGPIIWFQFFYVDNMKTVILIWWLWHH